jgi:hypothetical protein
MTWSNMIMMCNDERTIMRKTDDDPYIDVTTVTVAQVLIGITLVWAYALYQLYQCIAGE